MPAAPPPAAAFFFGFSAIMASVVRSRLATEAAFCRAVRDTLVGSMTPALSRSSKTSVAALKPKPGAIAPKATQEELAAMKQYPALQAVHVPNAAEQLIQPFDEHGTIAWFTLSHP